MNSSGSSDRPTPSRRLAWTGWGVLVVVLLLVAGFAGWLFSGGLGRLATAKAEEELRSSVERSKGLLREFAGDGELTDVEINTATSRLPDSDPGARRQADGISFDVEVHALVGGPLGSSGLNRCYRFTVTPPLDAGVDVQAVEVPTCRR